jgi:hypothetical protein
MALANALHEHSVAQWWSAMSCSLTSFEEMQHIYSTNRHQSSFVTIMAVDTVAAIGLAGNIVQFVDFSCKLFCQTQEIYSSASGTTSDTANLLSISKTLSEICQNLSASHLSSSRTPLSSEVDEDEG